MSHSKGKGISGPDTQSSSPREELKWASPLDKTASSFSAHKSKLKTVAPFIKTYAKKNYFLRQIQKEKEAARKKLMRKHAKDPIEGNVSHQRAGKGIPGRILLVS